MGRGLSIREKKILLLLLRLDDNGVDYTSHLREGNTITRILEPDSEHYINIKGNEVVSWSVEKSWNRTLLSLRRQGFVTSYREEYGYPEDRHARFRLTISGESEALKIRAEFKAYIAEWGPLS